MQAFELEALDYLTKPVRLERLQVTLQKVERNRLLRQGLKPDSTEEFLTIQARGRLQRLPLAQVLYVKAELKYLTVRASSVSIAARWWPGRPCVRPLAPEPALRGWVHRRHPTPPHEVLALTLLGLGLFALIS